MCGAFNANIIKHSLQFIQEDLKEFTESGNLQLFLIGKKGFDFFNKQKYPIFSFTPGIFGSLDFDSSKKVVSEIIKGYLEEKFDAVYVIYNEFKSIIQQRVIVEQFLPIPPEDITGIDHLKAIAQVEYIYEPSEKELMDELVQRHLNFQMWRILLESNAAEQGARMTAMDNATTNANELIQELTLSYNKARQAAITKELLEVVAGAEALKETG